MREPKPKLEVVLEQIQIICNLYESSPYKVERIMGYTKHIQKLLNKDKPKRGKIK